MGKLLEDLPAEVRSLRDRCRPERAPPQVCHCKKNSERSSQKDIQMIHRIRHDKIVNVFETFRFESSFYVVLERMAICLT